MNPCAQLIDAPSLIQAIAVTHSLSSAELPAWGGENADEGAPEISTAASDVGQDETCHLYTQALADWPTRRAAEFNNDLHRS